MDDSRRTWLEYVNAANDESRLARFSLSRDERGQYVMRMRAFAGNVYSRRTFATVMDLWHMDLDMLRRMPDAAPEEIDDEDTAAVSVH